MADPGTAISGILGNLFSGTFFIVGIVLVIIFVFGLIWGLIWYFLIYKKKFDITAKVISRRAGDDRIFFDKAAILNDKKNNKRYLKLFNTKVELELPKFNIFSHTNKGDYVEILRESEMGFRFLTPPVVEKNFIIRHDGKRYPMTQIKQYQIENDISWILDRQKINKRLIDPESVLMKLLAYAPQIVSMAVSFLAIFVVLKYMPDFFSKMADAIDRIGAKETVEVIGSFMPLGFLKWKRE